MNLSHTDENGKAKMVDVTGKSSNIRTASASGNVFLSKEAFIAIKENNISKGDVLSTARIAAIQGAKKTSELIPLCHNIFISSVEIDFIMNEEKYSIEILAAAKTNSVTGIEMEVLTAVSVGALTIYDMCKAVDKSILISDIHLVSKTGGKSGDYFAG